MARYRAGNDMTILWSINDRNGAALPLNNKEVHLYYTCERGRYEADIEIQDGNVVIWHFYGNMQRTLGDYTLTIEILQSNGKRTIKKDICNAFTLVGKQCEEKCDSGEAHINEGGVITLATDLDIYRISPVIPYVGEDGYWWVDGVKTEWNSTGPQGPQGNSAFDGTGVEIVNNLTQGGEAAVLSAEQGKILKQDIDELEERIDNLGEGGADGTGIEIVNNLTQGGADAALSAEQGKILKQGLDDLEERVDNIGEGGSGSGNYLPLTGGDITGDLSIDGVLSVGGNAIKTIDGKLCLYSNFALNILVEGEGANINGAQIIHEGNLGRYLEELGYTGGGSVSGNYLPLTGGTINGSLNVTGTIESRSASIDSIIYLDNGYHSIQASSTGDLAINSNKVLKVTTNGGMTIDGYEAIHAGNINKYVSSGSGSSGTVDTSKLVDLTGVQTITGAKTFEAIRIHGNAQLLTDLQVSSEHSIGSDEAPLGSISTKRATVKQVLLMIDGSYVLGNLVPNTLEANTLGSTEVYWKTLYAKNVVVGKEGEETLSHFNGMTYFNKGAYVRGKLQVLGKEVIAQKEVVQDSNTVTLAEEGGIYIINNLNAGDVTISAFEVPSGNIGRYTVIFRGASSLTLPSNALWANGVVPTIEADKYYELSVMATKIAGTTYYKAILAGFKSA